MKNLKTGLHFFFNSVSASVFPHIERWNLTIENGNAIKLEQVDKSLQNQEKISFYLEIYPQLIYIYVNNAEDKINEIVDKALYSFYHFKIETIVEITSSTNIDASVMFPTSVSKKEILEIELNSLLNKISQQSELETNFKKINNLISGIKLYEQFEIKLLKNA